MQADAAPPLQAPFTKAALVELTSSCYPGMSQTWPLTALACALALVQPGSAGTVPLACDTELELMGGLDFIREVCTQTGESFSSPYNPVPTHLRVEPMQSRR